jgi:hypothetical protein
MIQRTQEEARWNWQWESWTEEGDDRKRREERGGIRREAR